MAKNLIIVESPAKVRTIKKFLGKDYFVEASVGHIRDLPRGNLGVDEEQDFEPEYEVIPGKQKVVSKLKQAARKAEKVYLAPDPDREGEAIAWHVAALLDKENAEISRIHFNEITSRAVREALEHPRGLDERMFNSQQARRILDRLVGYKISPLLWSKVKRGISAGRVQSVALRIIVEREKERRAFEPEEYWLLKARLAADEPPAFVTDLWKVDGKKPKLGDAQAADEIEARVTKSPATQETPPVYRPFTVKEVAEKERKRHPVPPFITSTMQQDASRRLGFSAKRTMSQAQRLYEGVELKDRGTTALITYMRTDSVRVANEARDAARAYIGKNLGKDYLPDKPRGYKSRKGAQEAHEAIRPVDVYLTPEDVKDSLPRDQFRLYQLIWQRFMASQMAPARFWDTVVTAECRGTLWRAKGERLLFPGFLKVYGRDEGEVPTQLPKLQEGQTLTLEKLSKEQKFTQPPPRYSEASLVKELEDKGIGRPSTYASIISTLLDRDYARLEEKRFVPTELGTTVSDMLTRHFESLMDIGFTANMEESLDKVAEGEQDWVNLLKSFTGEFYPTLETARQNMKQVKGGMETDVACEKCGKPMVIRFGKMGEFLGCSGYPECRNIKDFERDDKGEIRIVERQVLEPVKVGECPDCGSDLVIKKARSGNRFIACTGYPKCKHAGPYSTEVACPREKCPGELIERASKRGKIFYSCSEYPKCDYATWDWPVKQECPECGHPILVRKSTKSRGEHLACPRKGCRYMESLPEPEEAQD